MADNESNGAGNGAPNQQKTAGDGTPKQQNGAGNGAPQQQKPAGNGAPRQQKPAGDGAPPQQTTAGDGAPPMTIRAHYLKDLSFENPKAPQSLMNMTQAPDIQVNINVDAKPMAENDFEVSLTITGEATVDGSTVFVVELTYAGIFTLGDVPPEHTGPMLLIEAPRLLFPFARRMISDATGEGGFPPLSIQPIDFVALYQQHVEAQQAEAEADAPPAEA